MKRNAPSLLTLLAIAGSGALAFAADDTAKSASKTETELTHEMDQMNSAFRKLRRQVADPAQNADSISQVAVLREHAQAALKLQPLKAMEVPSSDGPKMIKGYREGIQELLALLDRLEAALKAGRNEEASQLVQELVALQKSSHKEYKSKSLE